MLELFEEVLQYQAALNFRSLYTLNYVQHQTQSSRSNILSGRQLQTGSLLIPFWSRATQIRANPSCNYGLKWIYYCP